VTAPKSVKPAYGAFVAVLEFLAILRALVGRLGRLTTIDFLAGILAAWRVSYAGISVE
jgi:hypothetical protein